MPPTPRLGRAPPAFASRRVGCDAERLHRALRRLARLRLVSAIWLAAAYHLRPRRPVGLNDQSESATPNRATPEFFNKIAPQRLLLRGPSNATEGNFKTVSFGEQPRRPCSVEE